MYLILMIRGVSRFDASPVDPCRLHCQVRGFSGQDRGLVVNSATSHKNELPG